MNVFVFRPQGIAHDNVFSDWQALVTAMSSVEGRKMLEFDDSLVPAAVRRCEIPAGTWPMTDVTWAGFGPRPGVPRPRVDILSGAQLPGLRMIGNVTVVGQVFDGNSVFFFIQNCIFGIGSLNVPSTSPLIRFRGEKKVLALNLLGLNQTGPNVVRTEGTATVLFGALSSAAQVAFDQTTIVNDHYVFGPQGRIQRHVLPRPPAPPWKASEEVQKINKPNVLLRFDGTNELTYELPSISEGFTIGNTSVPLYSGGQEVVIAEVAGGTKLKVRPASKDTIDGSPDDVRIGRRGSKTFISDGLDNWITISAT